MASQMDNYLMDEVIKRRLIIDGDGAGDDRRILALMKAYVQFWNGGKDATPEERTAQKRRLLFQMHQALMSLQRTAAMLRVNEETTQKYVKLGEGLKEEIDHTKSHIKEYKHLLEEATLHRKYAMEYEALAKLIQSQPDRKDTEGKKAKLEAELGALKQKEKRLKDRMRARQQNISIFASTIETLKALMRNEDYDIETFHSATSGEEGMEVEENGEAEKPMDVDSPAPAVTAPPKGKEGKKTSKPAKNDKDKLHEDLSESDGEGT